MWVAWTRLLGIAAALHSPPPGKNMTVSYNLTFRLNSRFQNVHHGRFEIRFSRSNEMLWIYGDSGIACLLYQGVINS